MSEELSHALFVPTALEIHVSHETLRLSVTIWPLQKHSKVVEVASVALSDIDHKARFRPLLNRHFTTLFFGHDLDAGLRDQDLLFVEVRCDLDRGVTIDFNAFNGV